VAGGNSAGAKDDGRKGGMAEVKEAGGGGH
jgi:hypothetical protein